MLCCPDCRAALRPWGQSRPRTVRDLGGGLVTVRPDRARCTACGRTHVVLDAGLLPRRAYTVRFLGQALAGAVRGHGHRQIAAELGAPEDTVRGWLRRARRTAEQLRWIGVQAVVALNPDALPTVDRGDPLAHAVEALVAAAVASHACFVGIFSAGQHDRHGDRCRRCRTAWCSAGCWWLRRGGGRSGGPRS
ncbi:DUF6431 domain-containing protein [Streptomyces sp. NPDC088337]